jgi:hypothetical protein
MKVKTLLAAGLVAMTASGCQTFQSIDDAAGSWAREIKADRAASGNAADRAAQCEQPINEAITVATDVDTAYARLKRTLGYRTEAERGVDKGFEATYAGVRHEALPGARYSMANYVRVSDRGASRRGWLVTDIERNGRGAVIRLRYCIGGGVGFDPDPGFQDRLRAQVAGAARG